MDNEKLTQLLETQTMLLKQLADNQMHMKHDTANADGTNTPLHGDGGIFRGPGLERDVITAHIRPFGIGAMLPLFKSIDLDPRFASLTGYTAPIGNQPTNSCDAAPTAYMKGCNLSARFGRIRYDTQEIDFDDIMMRVNRGDFMDLQLRGRVLARDIGPKDVAESSDILNLVVQSEMVNVGVQFERELGRQMWQGVVTATNEFPGIDVQVATGQVDADTNTACPALDSDVKSFNYRLLDETIVDFMSMLEYYIYNNAEKMGLLPATWVWAMRPQLWHELTQIWPCAYNTNRCASYMETGGTTFIDGRENVAQRDGMRRSMSIDINGRTYKVVTDDGIFEHNNINNANCAAGEYASTIYFLPLTITGSFPVLYRQHKDYQAGQRQLSPLNGQFIFWTDGGAYSWTMSQTRWCFDLSAKTEQRVILRTPQLAGRIDAVKYAPMQHLRDSDPDSAYWADGGVSVRSGLGLPYAVWSGR